MDANLICIFILFWNAAFGIEEVAVNSQDTQRNEHRDSRARFPFFGSIFGSTTVNTLTASGANNPNKENSNTAYGSSWNNFEFSDIVGDSKRKDGSAAQYILHNTTSISNYQSGTTSGYESEYFIFENSSERNGSRHPSTHASTSSDIYHTGILLDNAVVYSKQNGTGSETGDAQGSGWGSQITVTELLSYDNDRLSPNQDSGFQTTKTTTSINSTNNKNNLYQFGSSVGSGSSSQESISYSSNYGTTIRNPTRANDFQSSSKTITHYNQGNIKTNAIDTKKKTVSISDGTKGSSNSLQLGDSYGSIAESQGTIIYSTSYGDSKIVSPKNSEFQSSIKSVTYTDQEGIETSMYDKTSQDINKNLYGKFGNSQGNTASNQETAFYWTDYKSSTMTPTQTSGSYSSIKRITYTDQGDVKTNAFDIINQGNKKGSAFTNTKSNNVTAVELDFENSSMLGVTNNSSEKNTESLDANIFLGGNEEVSATNLYSNYLHNKKPSEKFPQSSLSSYEVSLLSHDIVPNALSHTNIQETGSVLQNSNENKNSDVVIVICTDPTTGSVIAKYESANNLQEYKNTMVEKDGLTEWAAIGGPSTSISLPTQLIEKNISMIIRGRIHYCQIVNITNAALSQETVDSKIVQTQAMTYDATGNNLNLPSSDLTTYSSFMNFITKPITSTITVGMDFVSTLFGGNQNDTQTSNKPSASNTTNSDWDTHSELFQASTIKSESLTSSLETMSSESVTEVTEDSKHNKESSPQISSALYEAHYIPSSENRTANKGSKESEESNSKQDLFISHYGDVSAQQNKIRTPQVSSQELHISSYLEHKHFKDKPFYSKNPNIHGETPFYSMHIYHHSDEEDSKTEDSKEDRVSQVFFSKPVTLDEGENKKEEFVVQDTDGDNDNDDVSSDFEKINTETTYPVFSFFN